MHTSAPHPPADAPAASGDDGHRSGGPAMAARPVFVDPSGRRQRRVRRLGWLLVVPAAGYAALLLSAAIGGPSVDSPYLPLPAAGDHGSSATTRPPAPDTAGRTPAAAPAGDVPGPASPTARATAGGRPTASGSSPHPSAPGAASAPATAVPTVTHGRSSATHPVPAHTGHGHG